MAFKLEAFAIHQMPQNDSPPGSYTLMQNFVSKCYIPFSPLLLEECLLDDQVLNLKKNFFGVQVKLFNNKLVRFNHTKASNLV
jgi:hypothetical protein